MDKVFKILMHFEASFLDTYKVGGLARYSIHLTATALTTFCICLTPTLRVKMPHTANTPPSCAYVIYGKTQSIGSKTVLKNGQKRLKMDKNGQKG